MEIIAKQNVGSEFCDWDSLMDQPNGMEHFIQQPIRIINSDNYVGIQLIPILRYEYPASVIRFTLAILAILEVYQRVMNLKGTEYLRDPRTINDQVFLKSIRDPVDRD
jgi:hypothetical protein